MPQTPFLCRFVDSVKNRSKGNDCIDFREFLAKTLKILPTKHNYSDRCVLILSTNLDRETDIVCVELIRRGIDYVRLNVEEIHTNLSIEYGVEQDSNSQSQIKIGSLLSNLSDISAVWLRDFDYSLIHPNTGDLSTAFIFQQWNDSLQHLFSTMENRWINNYEATHRTNNRMKQLIVAKQLGFNIPSTLVTNNPEKARRFYYEHNGDIILKVLHHHDIELLDKVYSIYSHRATNEDVKNFEDLSYAPSVLQERIHTCSEYRVIVVKDRVFSVQFGSDRELQCSDVHRIPLSRLSVKPALLENEHELQCVKLVKSLGLDYGAIDFVVDENAKFYFLEVNPTGDWLWIEDKTKLPITRAVVDLIENVVNARI